MGRQRPPHPPPAARFYAAALVFVIKKLLQHERASHSPIASDFLNRLFPDANLHLQGDWDIESPMADHADGEPDIIITAPGLLAFLKVTESKRANPKRLAPQVRALHASLANEGARQGVRATLLLLTPFGGQSHKASSTFESSWLRASQLLGEIDESLPAGPSSMEDALRTRGLIQTFRQFLKENGLAVEKLHHAPTSSDLPSVVSLLMQVRWALEAQGLSAGKNEGHSPASIGDWMGWQLKSRRKAPRYSCGIYLSFPSEIVVRCHGAADSHLPQIPGRAITGGNWLPLKDGFEYRTLDGGYILEIRKPLPNQFPISTVEKQVARVQDIIKAALDIVEFKDSLEDSPKSRFPSGCVKSTLDQKIGKSRPYFIPPSTPKFASKGHRTASQRTLLLQKQAKPSPYSFLASGCYLSAHSS
ncbi:MAG: hypothetical protein FJ320_02950 [SAR202 cluster bacterium]|nr:hypothetical protein [SAR202 cluster bacterium]